MNAGQVNQINTQANCDEVYAIKRRKNKNSGKKNSSSATIAKSQETLKKIVGKRMANLMVTKALQINRSGIKIMQTPKTFHTVD